MKLWEYLKIILLSFINKKQEEFLKAVQKFKVWVGGRGSGKTNVEAFTMNNNMSDMPGSAGFMYGKDLGQMKTKEIKEISKVWERLGLYEKTQDYPMGDYVIGIKPPKGFKILNKSEEWKHIISFVDGSTIEFISQQQKANRGGSYDWGVVVEASLLNEADFWKNIFPMVRGLKGKYKCNSYLSWAIFSNMPELEIDYWVPDLEKLAIKYPDEYFYMESTIYDNVAVFGQKVIDKIKNSLFEIGQQTVWFVEYMNKRNVTINNPFYGEFRFGKHTYKNVNYQDPFYNSLQPLIVSFDFNNTFNSCNVGQLDQNVRSFQKEFFEFAGERYTILPERINEYYNAFQIKKHIIIQGDQDGNDRLDDQNCKSFYDNIKVIFEELGWTVEIGKTKLMRNPGHLVKRFQINETLREPLEKNDWVKIRINEEECRYTLISIKFAKRDKNGKKDKSSEQKLKGTDRKYATDLSDCFDYGSMPYITHQFTNNGGSFSIEAHEHS